MRKFRWLKVVVVCSASLRAAPHKSAPHWIGHLGSRPRGCGPHWRTCLSSSTIASAERRRGGVPRGGPIARHARGATRCRAHARATRARATVRGFAQERSSSRSASPGRRFLHRRRLEVLAGRQNKIWWSPIHDRLRRKGLLVRAALWSRGNAGRYGARRDSGIWMPSPAAAGVGPSFPAVSQCRAPAMLVIATSGNDWGCFLRTSSKADATCATVPLRRRRDTCT